MSDERAKPKVFLPEPISSAGIDLLRPRVNCVTPWIESTIDDTEQIRHELAEAVIVRLFSISKKDLDNCTHLKVIAKHGVGVDNIDVEAAAKRGISVVYTPQANSNAVAEHSVALLLSLARRIEPASAAVKAGRFAERNRFQGVELFGKTLGVVGLGRIGQKVAYMASFGFSMNVIGYDPVWSDRSPDIPIEQVKRVEEVFERSDFLTFHVPLTDTTRHLVSRKTLALVKPRCQLVNTS